MSETIKGLLEQRAILNAKLAQLCATNARWDGYPAAYRDLVAEMTRLDTVIERISAGASKADAELISLAALANVEAVLMAGENAQREAEGLSPAWRYGTGMMPAANALSDELLKRGYKL